MTDCVARLACGPTPDTIKLIPVQPKSVRQLERSLSKGGLQPIVTRNPPNVVVPIKTIGEVRSILSEWSILTDSDIDHTLKQRDDFEERIARGKLAIERLQDLKLARSQISNLEGLEKLDDHQVVAVAASTHADVPGICIFDEQGLGKTIEALFAYHLLYSRGEISKMLVFAPKNMALEWANDCRRFFGDRYTVTPITGSEREKRKALDIDSDIYVTNFEAALSVPVKLRRVIERSKGDVLMVVDESFYVKNPGAARTKAIKQLRDYCKRCIVLCGTPAPNSPHDIVEQFNIADKGVTFSKVDIPDDYEEARRVISRTISERGLYLRRIKQEVLPDLPDKFFTRVQIPMEPGQLTAYSAALKALIKDVASSDEVSFKKNITSFMAQRASLLQICSNPKSVVDDYHETPAKLAALDSILEDLITVKGEKVVLWSFYKTSIQNIFDRYQTYNPVRIDGSIPDVLDRREAVRSFQEDNETMLFVGNPAAAGAGITLHSARYAIYESFSNQAAHYLQSLDRIHRRGQTRSVEYIILLCDQSLELREYDRLLQKESSAQKLLGDTPEDSVTRETFLSDLKYAADMIRLDYK